MITLHGVTIERVRPVQFRGEWRYLGGRHDQEVELIEEFQKRVGPRCAHLSGCNDRLTGLGAAALDVF